MKRRRPPDVSVPLTTRTLDTTPRYWSNWLSKINACRAASGSPVGGGIVSTIGIEQLWHAFTGLRRDAHDVVGRDAEDVLDLGGEAVGVGGGEVDLVERGDDRQIVLEGEVAVGEGLRLDALGGVDDEHDPLARCQRTTHLVTEVDVAGSVDEVERVSLPVDAHVLRLDRDPPLALEVHRVEVLLAHVARLDGPGQFEDAVRERRLAVVDVGDDREVANLRGHAVHCVPRPRRPCLAARSLALARSQSAERAEHAAIWLDQPLLTVLHQAALATSSLIRVDHTLGGGLVEALDRQPHVVGVGLGAGRLRGGLDAGLQLALDRLVALGALGVGEVALLLALDVRHVFVLFIHCWIGARGYRLRRSIPRDLIGVFPQWMHAPLPHNTPSAQTLRSGTGEAGEAGDEDLDDERRCRGHDGRGGRGRRRRAGRSPGGSTCHRGGGTAPSPCAPGIRA